MPIRFRDDGSQPGIDGSVLVRCPRCQGCAEIVPIPEDSPLRRNDLGQFLGKVRISCQFCGYSQISGMPRQPRYSRSGMPIYTPASAPVDVQSGLPLWLQTPCAGQVLWAWNEWHLDWLERYVAADLRERTPNINTSLASRLPRWIKSAKHRDEVLKGIRRLRAKLADRTPAR